MITQNIHVRMDAYGIPPVIHAVEGDTWRYLDIYTDDAAINTSNTAAVAIHRPDNSYYTISATPNVGGFYHLEMDQALTRPGKVECQLKVSSGDLVISTYTFYIVVEPSTTGLPTEQLGYDIYDLIDAAQQIQNVGLTEEIKQALLDCFEHVAWTDEHGQDYVDALEAALYPPAELVSISAVYTQSGTVYTTASLDDLKSDLVVTAAYTDSTTETVTTYTLSGTLTEGTSVITVSYGGKTTTFNVTVTAPATLSSITAVYTQSGTVYDTDTLDSLKSDLVVTAVYSDSTTETVASSDYTLSGTLTAGTSTVTVSYDGKTTTFSVTVTHAAGPGEDWTSGVAYDYTGKIVSGEYYSTLYHKVMEYGGWSRTDYMPCKGAASISFASLGNMTNPGNYKYNAFFDENKSEISSFTLASSVTQIAVPNGAYWWMVSAEDGAMQTFASGDTIPTGA